MEVVITRHPYQSRQYIRALRDYGHSPNFLPLMRIKSLLDSQPAIKTRINQLLQQLFDKIIFVSPNAARLSLPFLKQSTDTSYFAIGPATSPLLQNFLFPQMSSKLKQAEPPYNSESLLQLPELQQLVDQRILILCGENSRPLLQQQLELRGAQVSLCPVYRRIALPDLHQTVNQCALKPDVLTAMSGEAAKILYNAILASDKNNWLHLPLVVPGTRVTQIAQTLGFSSVLTLDYPDPQLLIKALSNINQQ